MSIPVADLAPEQVVVCVCVCARARMHTHSSHRPVSYTHLASLFSVKLRIEGML